MASVVQSVGGNGNTASVVVNLPANATIGNQLIAIVSSFQLSASLTCTSAHGTWTKLIAVDGDATHNDWVVFICQPSLAATKPVTIGNTGSLQTTVQVLELYGTLGASALKASDTTFGMNDNTSPYTSGSVTAGDGDLTIAVLNINRSGTVAKPGSPWNTIADAVGATNPSQYLVWRNDAGTFTASFTDTVADPGSTMILVVAAAPIAPVTVVRPIIPRLMGTKVQAFLGRSLAPTADAVAATVYNDSGSGTITLSGDGSESNTHTGSGSGTITLSGTGTESYVPPSGVTFNDSGAGTITLSGAGTQSQTHTGSGAGTITLSGSATQSSSHTSSGTGTITLTGTGVQSFSHSGSGTGTGTLSGSGTQTQTHTGAGAGTITLSGFGAESYVPPGGGGAVAPPSGDQAGFQLSQPGFSGGF